MKRIILTTAALLSSLSYCVPSIAANPAQVKQLLTTKQCPKCDLVGLDLRGDPVANPNGLDLSGANLQGANLSGARLALVNLQGANLSNAILLDSDLLRANLSQANLKGADLRASTLNFANLSGANLSGADLRDAFLKGTVLTGANFTNANLLRVNLDENQGKDLPNTGSNIAASTQPWENARVVQTIGENLKWEAVSAIAISPDGQILAIGSHNYARAGGGGESFFTLWNLKTGEQLLTLFQGSISEFFDSSSDQEPPDRRVGGLHGDYIYSIAFSPDGQTIAAGMSNKTIKLYNVKTGQEIRTLRGHKYAVHAIAITPDGQTLISGSSDNTIKLWNLTTGQLIRTIQAHTKPVHAIALSADGQFLASGSADKSIKVWQLKTGKLLSRLVDIGEIRSVRFSQDGQTLASTRTDYNALNTNNNPALKLWNWKAGKPVSNLEGNFYKNAVNVTFSPDGQTLASYVANHDNPGGQLVKLWNYKTGSLIRTFGGIPLPNPILAFSPDGQVFITNIGPAIQVWR
jgi:WD40 repeat protein